MSTETKIDPHCLKVEQMILAAGLTFPRIKPEEVEALVVEETYTRLPSGKKMVCELTLKNGFTVTGEASVVCIENYRDDIGREVSRRNAMNQVWLVAGYALQDRLFREAEGRRLSDIAADSSL